MSEKQEQSKNNSDKKDAVVADVKFDNTKKTENDNKKKEAKEVEKAVIKKKFNGVVISDKMEII